MALAASGAMPTRQLDKAELRDVVRAALAGLSERQRMAVLLNKFEEMSYADIATADGDVAAGDQVAVVAGPRELEGDLGAVFGGRNPAVSR